MSQPGPSKSTESSTHSQSQSVRLDVADLKRLQEAFDQLDLNGDGSISADELASGLQQLGQTATAEELSQMIAVADQNRDGTIRFKEFCVLMAHHPGQMNPLAEPELTATFNRLDTDKDGLITAEELSLNWPIILGGNITPAEALEMVNLADADGDGKINLEEFKRFAAGITANKPPLS